MANGGILAGMPGRSFFLFSFGTINNVYPANTTGWPILQLHGYIYGGPEHSIED